jgi:hypothetical protein
MKCISLPHAVAVHPNADNFGGGQSMTRYFIFVSVMLMAGMTTSAWSQVGQGGGTAGATATTQTGARQNRLSTNSNLQAEGQFSAANRAFNPVNPTPWFNDPGARQQLMLKDNQFNQLNRAYQDAFARYNQAVTRLNNNLPEQQRMQQLQQLQARFNQEFDAGLNNAFTDPQFRQRFNQLNWQFQGPMAFNDPAIRQQLNLTPAQQRQLRQINMQWRQQLNQLRLAGQADPNLTQQWMTFQTQYRNQLGGILTPTQQQTFHQLLGQQYAFPVNTYLQLDANASTPTGQNGSQVDQGVQRAQRPAPRETRPSTLR